MASGSDILEQRRRGAVMKVVTEGSKACAVAIAVMASAHMALSRWAPRYRALDSYGKRIVFACGTIGSFWITAQLTAGRNVQDDMMRDAEKVEIEDAKYRRAAQQRQSSDRVNSNGSPEVIR